MVKMGTLGNRFSPGIGPVGRLGSHPESPPFFWLYPVLGIRGASWFLGGSEWLFAALLFWGFWNKKAGILGALGCCFSMIGTVTIIPFMPEGWDAAAGFPAMKGNVAFLIRMWFFSLPPSTC